MAPVSESQPPEESAAAAASFSRSSGLRAELGSRGPRAGGGGRADVGGWGGGWAARWRDTQHPSGKHFQWLRADPDTKGGVAAAASLRRSRSLKSPRLRHHLRLLLSLQLFPALSVSGLCCSADGGGRGGGATKLALRLRARGPARPRPSLPGLLGPTRQPWRRASHPNQRGQGGAGIL